jgi:hypothetical protein
LDVTFFKFKKQDNNIGDNGAKLLSESLLKNPTLQHLFLPSFFFFFLNFSENGLTVISCVTIGKVLLSPSSNLKTLDLSSKLIFKLIFKKETT